MGKKIFSFDAETNGLEGHPFSIAAFVCDEEGVEIDRFVGRCPIMDEVDVWVLENVLPPMEGIDQTHATLLELLRAFSEFYLKYTDDDTIILAHVQFPVEARVLTLMKKACMITTDEAPFPLHDTASVLEMLGEESTKHGAYKKKYDIDMSDIGGGWHNPLYDSVLTARVWIHLRKRVDKLIELAAAYKS